MAGRASSAHPPTLTSPPDQPHHAVGTAPPNFHQLRDTTSWKLRCRAVADSLEEAGERLFTFLRYPAEQWRSLRTTNAIERLHEEFKRRIKTQCLLPCAETAAMLFWALLASGQITMRRVDGWQTLDRSPSDLDLAA